MIEKYLLEGKKNAIKSQKLADLTGCKSVRELQEVIEFTHTLRRRAKNTLAAIELAIKKLEELSALPFSGGMDNDLAIQILNQSIMNSWQGLFPLKEQKTGGTPQGGVDWSKV